MLVTQASMLCWLQDRTLSHTFSSVDFDSLAWREEEDRLSYFSPDFPHHN